MSAFKVQLPKQKLDIATGWKILTHCRLFHRSAERQHWAESGHSLRHRPTTDLRPTADRSILSGSLLKQTLASATAVAAIGPKLTLTVQSVRGSF